MTTELDVENKKILYKVLGTSKQHPIPLQESAIRESFPDLGSLLQKLEAVTEALTTRPAAIVHVPPHVEPVVQVNVPAPIVHMNVPEQQASPIQFFSSSSYTIPLYLITIAIYFHLLFEIYCVLNTTP